MVGGISLIWAIPTKTLKYCNLSINPNMAFFPSRKAAAILGLHPQTLRNYADQGKIPYYRNSAGQRLYDVDAFLGRASKPETVCYCRVSSAKQRGDLRRQCAFITLSPPCPRLARVFYEQIIVRRSLLKFLEQQKRLGGTPHGRKIDDLIMSGKM